MVDSPCIELSFVDSVAVAVELFGVAVPHPVGDRDEAVDPLRGGLVGAVEGTAMSGGGWWFMSVFLAIHGIGPRPDEGQQPIGGLEARRATPGEPRAEAGVRDRKLPEAPDAHVPAMATGRDDAAQGGIQRRHSR